jgi:anaerobic selenocysteine-containing dehydrogenase
MVQRAPLKAATVAPEFRRLASADIDPSSAERYTSPETLYRDQWSWDRVVKGTCNQADCIAACTLNLFVKDGIVWREEQNAIYEASGDHLPDFNPRGCQKGMVYSDLMYDATRIKYPMRRVGERGSGKWERITWDEALTEIADKIMDVVASDGPEAIIYDNGTTNIDFGLAPPRSLASLTSSAPPRSMNGPASATRRWARSRPGGCSTPT